MIVIDTPQTLGWNLSSDDEDMLVTELIAQLQKLLKSIPEHQRDNVKCGVRSYWTDNGGYLNIYISSHS